VQLPFGRSSWRHREIERRSRRTRSRALLAAELVLKAQTIATRPVLS
jgi:hypothetical protein